MTQHEKIIEMCKIYGWYCQNDFRALQIYSPHKRRSEIEAMGEYKFISRKCQHGVRGQFDYQMQAVAQGSHKLYSANALPVVVSNCCVWGGKGNIHSSTCRVAYPSKEVKPVKQPLF